MLSVGSNTREETQSSFEVISAETHACRVNCEDQVTTRVRKERVQTAGPPGIHSFGQVHSNVIENLSLNVLKIISRCRFYTLIEPIANSKLGIIPCRQPQHLGQMTAPTSSPKAWLFDRVADICLECPFGSISIRVSLLTVETS